MPALEQRLLPPWLRQHSQFFSQCSKELYNDNKVGPLAEELSSKPRLDAKSEKEFEIELPHTHVIHDKATAHSGEMIEEL